MRNLLLMALIAVSANGQASSAVKLSVGVNGTVQTALAPGWPLAVRATVVASGGDTTLAAPDGHWSSALHLTVTDPLGEVVELPLASRLQGEPTVELQEWDTASAVWWMGPEQTEVLRPGVYIVRIELDGQRTATGSFRIGLDDDTSEEDREVTRLLLMSQWAEWEGRFDDAIAHAETVFEKQPGSMAAHLRIADVQASAGRYREALNTLQLAENLFDTAHGDDVRPPVSILARRRAVTAKLEAAMPATMATAIK